MMRRPRIAIVSPFLDKRHGTECCVAEQTERLARDHGFEIHLFSERVEDIPGVSRVRDWRAARSAAERAGPDSSGILVWHRVVGIPGPYLLKHIWWFAANHISRWLARQRGARYDLVYTPGVNCLNADLISVHIVFAEFVRQAKNELRLRNNPISFWPRLIHRRIYYRLLIVSERLIYGRPDQPLSVISRKVADDLKRFYGRNDPLPVVYHGLDFQHFNPALRARLRPASRQALGLAEDDFAVLLVGNDFTKKGLRYLLAAAAQVSSSRLRLFVAGHDDPVPYAGMIESTGLKGRVQFLPVRPDVEFYYAAADLYAGPSLEDAFALPPAEAMACGVPAIVSRQAGVSEIITHGIDSYILEDPTDVKTLANLIRALLDDPELRRSVGGRAVSTAANYTWERNVDQMKQLLLQVLADKQQPSPSV